MGTEGDSRRRQLDTLAIDRATDTMGSFAAQERLSPRQRAVLALLIAGFAPKEMETALGIAGPTVRFHAVQLYKRFGVRNQREMLALVARTVGPGREQ